MGLYYWEGTDVQAVPYDWEYVPSDGEDSSVARVLVPNFADDATAVVWLENMLLPSKQAVIGSLYSVLQAINEEPFPPREKADYYIPLEWLKPELGSNFTNVTDDGRATINIQPNVKIVTAPAQLAYTNVLPGNAYERLNPALSPGDEWSGAVYASAQGVHNATANTPGQNTGGSGGQIDPQSFIYTSETPSSAEIEQAGQFQFEPPFADDISNFIGLGAQVAHRVPTIAWVGIAAVVYLLFFDKSRERY